MVLRCRKGGSESGMLELRTTEREEAGVSGRGR